MILRQSTMKAWNECPLKVRWQLEGLQRNQGGSAIFGSVIHDCILWMEVNQDVEGAIQRFKELWTYPERLDPTYRVDYYERGRSWTKFMEKGPDLLQRWWNIIQWESDHVLAREHTFNVPIGNGHTLNGTVDKLAIRWHAATEQWIVLISDYKGLALDTPLPTPTGWTTMGKVQVGDQVIGGDGLPCRVAFKSEVHLKDCYRVTFDDGSSIIADHEHRWEVHGNYGIDVLTTKELSDQLVDPKTGQRHLRIPNVVTQLPNAPLPIDPYVLGAWLGDGSRGSGVVTKPLPRLFEEIEQRGFEVGPLLGNGGRTIYGLAPRLRDLGVLNDKHIPQQYLRASEEQRLELMRGIMDTDGHWNSTRRRCVLNTTDERYARQVYELAVSLGWKAATFVTTANGFGKTVPAWQTWFTPVDRHVFAARIPSDYRLDAPKKSRRRMVMSVERVPTVETQCIGVDSQDNTYLCGEQMVVTHNTNAKVPTYGYLEEDLQFTAYSYASLQPEFWTNIGGQEAYERFKSYPRHGEWVQLTEARRMDAGIREQRHFNRLIMAANAMGDSIDMGIFVPTISGETCRFCDFRKQCGLPEIMEED